MAQSSQSHETLVNILKDGLKENDNVYRDVLHSSLIDDFFSESLTESESLEIVRLATFDVGTYKPGEVEWKFEDDKVLIRGKRTRRTANSAEGTQFARVVTIPEEIAANTVTARFCVGDGVLVVEGKKKNKTTRKRITKQSSFFSDASFSLSIDLGDESPFNVNYGTQQGQIDQLVGLFK